MRPATTLDASPRPAPSDRIRVAARSASIAQSALLLVSFVGLIVSWSLTWEILLHTPYSDITGLEPTLLVGLVILLALRAWRLLELADRRWVIVLAAYFGWFFVAALAHRSGEDLKRATSYLFFGGIAAAVMFAAIRLDRERAARWIIGFFVAAVAIALFGAALENGLHTATGEDPLPGLWRLFRRDQAFADPRLGVFLPGPLHYPLGEPGLIRTAGFWAHPVYLAFFGLLATALTAALLITSWRAGSRRAVLASSVALGCAIFVTYWTYSRAPLVAAIAVVPFVAGLDLVFRFWRSRRRPSLRDLAPGVTAVATIALVLGVTLAVDNVGVRRLQGTAGAFEDDVLEGASVEASAARSTALRVKAQALAIEMITQSPVTALVGTGTAAYEVALATGPNRGGNDIISHPHNGWLTEALAGGIPAVILFVLVLGTVWLLVARAWGAVTDGPRRAVLLWLAGWIPAWAVAQSLGLNPFAAHEAVVFWTVMGIGLGFSLPNDPPATDSTPTTSTSNP